jgi:hypothetical protein
LVSFDIQSFKVIDDAKPVHIANVRANSAVYYHNPDNNVSDFWIIFVKGVTYWFLFQRMMAHCLSIRLNIHAVKYLELLELTLYRKQSN